MNRAQAPGCHPCIGQLLATLALAATLPAAAGDVTALAVQNLSPPVSDVNPGSLAVASFTFGGVPVAAAITTRTSIDVWADGSGVGATQARGGTGNSRTDFQLWDLGTGAPLAGVLATGLLLAFDFRVSGSTVLPPISLSTVGASYNVSLFSSFVESSNSSLNAVYGPTGYLVVGDAGLFGGFDFSFSLRHGNSVNGLMVMGLSVGAANAGDADASFELAGVRQLAGTLPAGGLAVRLQTGEELLVSPVPELNPVAMMMAGLMMVGLLRWRRGDAAAGFERRRFG